MRVAARGADADGATHMGVACGRSYLERDREMTQLALLTHAGKASNPLDDLIIREPHLSMQRRQVVVRANEEIVHPALPVGDTAAER